MAYSDKVIDHYENPRNVGSFDKSDESVGTGMVGAPACGDVMKLQIRVGSDGRIEDARFKTYGCGSALAYKLEFADTVNPGDQQFESHGVKLFVDPKSLQYIDGTELDYAREGLNEGFKFRNPKVKDECGCGESFNV